jgi:hypothetical protein
MPQNPLIYVAVILSAVIAFYIFTLKSANTLLSMQLDSAKVELITTRTSLTLVNSALEDQTYKIDANKIELEKALADRDKWKNKPKEVKFKYIYESIPAEVNLTRSNCEDVSNLLNSYNGLSI